jgi:hypothetical protein
LIFAGSQAAHVVAYRLVYPSSQVRMQELLATGHGTMQRLLPLALAVACAMALVSLVAAAAQAAHGRPVRGVPAWAFGALPLAAFTVQEVLERSLHTGTFVWQALESPTYLPGLALQLPFALAAWQAARVLLRAAERLGRSLVLPPRAVAGPLADLLFPLLDPLPRRRPLACALAKRGPPSSFA